MLDNLLAVALQVLMLFVMILVGFVAGKAKIIKQDISKGLADLVLYVATPAAILQSFTSEEKTYEKSLNLLFVFLAALLIHIITILITKLLIKNKDERKRKILRFSVIFSNCGYMSFPLQKAILGDIGVFYGAMFVAVFNIILWTYGALLASGDKKNICLKKILLNPTIISVCVSIILYALEIRLPAFLSGAVTGLGNLNTPLPMIIIGYNLSTFSLIKLFTDKDVYWPSIMRLLLIPLVSIGIMKLIGIGGIPFIACTVAASAPSAAVSAMFATKYGLDASLASKIVSLTTVFSILTMPVFVALAQM